MRRLFSMLFALAGAAALMLQVGPHDAATNVCNWLPFWRACPQSLPNSFDKWAWVFPAILFAAAVGVLLWTPAFHLFQAWKNRDGLVDLKDAAAQLYGELRGTDLGRFTEGQTGGPEEILDNIGMQILHNANVMVRRHPSPKWELFPRSELNKMGVCEGATAIRYWGQDRLIYSDPRVSRRDLARVTKELKENANFISEWSKVPPKKADINIKLHEGPAYESGLIDANGNSLPDDWVFLARFTGGDKFLSKCQIFLEDRNGHNFTASKPFDIRPGEPKDLPVLRFKNRDARDSRAFLYMLRPEDCEILPDGPAVLLSPGRYQIKVLSAEAPPATLDVHLSKHAKIPDQWILEEVRS